TSQEAELGLFFDWFSVISWILLSALRKETIHETTLTTRKKSASFSFVNRLTLGASCIKDQNHECPETASRYRQSQGGNRTRRRRIPASILLQCQTRPARRPRAATLFL